MPFHEWGDDDFDWKSLNECVRWFPTQLHRYARFPLMGCKEKYGTMRLEWVGCTVGGVYGLIFPGQLNPYFKYKIIHSINKWSSKIAWKIGLGQLFWKYQLLVFNLVTLTAYYKWPRIIREITSDEEFSTWLYRPIKRKIGFTCTWQTCNKDGTSTWVDPEFHPKPELPDDTQ